MGADIVRREGRELWVKKLLEEELRRREINSKLDRTSPRGVWFKILPSRYRLQEITELSDESLRRLLSNISPARDSKSRKERKSPS